MILYNRSMSKAKEEPKAQPKNPFAGFSRFGKPPQYSGQKFTPKGISTRPTFVTQHKGGGGK
jgi:hypothetical protein